MNRGYPWPASALGPEEMRLLHEVRESGAERIPITRLIRDAVIETYRKEDNEGDNE